MSQKAVSLVDVGLVGNIASIRRALEAAGATVSLVLRPEQLQQASKLVLPGVGSFAEAMAEITSLGWLEPLRQAASNKPTLGICLGMQLLARIGFEFGESEGLGLVDGEVRRMTCKAPVPHIGFKPVQPVGEPRLFRGLPAEAEFYFMHSFEVVNYTDVAALSEHGNHRFVCALQREQLFGVQFHPEKSREAGLAVLRNFVEL